MKCESIPESHIPATDPPGQTETKFRQHGDIDSSPATATDLAIMRFRSVLILMFLAGFVVLFCSGCLMKRTVSEDGVTVAEGYVVKGPLQM
jgi:hypothetical protein